MTLNLTSLPDPAIIEALSFQTIFNDLKDDFSTRFSEYSALVESDPAIKLLEVAAQREVILRQRVNDAFKATLLAFAAGTDLDQLAAYGLTRLTDELDADLRERTINRIQGSSTAGGAAWYRYQALDGTTMVCEMHESPARQLAKFRSHCSAKKKRTFSPWALRPHSSAPTWFRWRRSMG